MEKKLKELFDFQKYQGNSELQQVIDAVHAKYAVRELSLSDMDMVFAAGVPENPNPKKDGEE